MTELPIEGLEIDQKTLESLNVADRFGFFSQDYKSLGLQESREKSAMDLFKQYKHLLVTADDQVYGDDAGDYKLIKTAPGLFQAASSYRI